MNDKRLPEEVIDEVLDDPDLNYHEKQFVIHYIQSDFNAKAAALKAGYTTASATNASKFVEKPAVKAAINRIVKRHIMNETDIQYELAKVARGGVQHFFRLDTNRGEQGEVVLDLKQAQEMGVLHLIKRIKQTNFTTDIEFVDVLKALELLMKANGMHIIRDIGEDWRKSMAEYGYDEDTIREAEILYNDTYNQARQAAKQILTMAHITTSHDVE